MDSGAQEVTHLQFADDSIIFSDAPLSQVATLKLILRWFGLSCFQV